MSEEQTNRAVATVERRPVGLFEQMEREFDDLRRRMAELFRRPFGVGYRPTAALGEVAWSPTADAFVMDGALVIKAELPGVKKEDISVTVDGGLLTIEGKRTEEKTEKSAKYYTAERFSGAFARSFALPEGVDTHAITASYKDGVLEVRVPLPPQATSEPTRIPIHA